MRGEPPPLGAENASPTSWSRDSEWKREGSSETKTAKLDRLTVSEECMHVWRERERERERERLGSCVQAYLGVIGLIIFTHD